MGKALVVVLATLAALAFVVYFVGASRVGSVAVDVPSTTHSPAFGVTWTVILLGGFGLMFWKIVKGK